MYICRTSRRKTLIYQCTLQLVDSANPGIVSSFVEVVKRYQWYGNLPKQELSQQLVT